MKRTGIVFSPLLALGTLAAACRVHSTSADDGLQPAVNGSAPAARVETRTLGVLPTKLRFASDALRGVVDAALDMHLSRLTAIEVVERREVDRLLNELADTGLNRRDLQVGNLLGAEVLVGATLVADEKNTTQLELTALETATGRVLVRDDGRVEDEAGVLAAVERFAARLPDTLARAPYDVNVAVLPFKHISPFAEDGGLADDVRERIAARISRFPGVRVLDRSLARFVLGESALAAARLVDSQRRVVPEAGVVRVEGRVEQVFPDGKPLEQSLLTLKLTVMHNGVEDSIEEDGTLSGAADVEASICERLRRALAGIASGPLTVPEGEADEDTRRFWEAEKLFAAARRSQGKRAAELALEGAQLAPASAQPYAIVRTMDYEYQPGPDGKLAFRAEDDPVLLIRRQFLDARPDHELWSRAVGQELRYLVSKLEANAVAHAGIAIDGGARRRALALARRESARVIHEGSKPDFLASMIQLLVLSGEPQLAFRVCVAAMPRESGAHPWGGLSYFVGSAIDAGELDWAWKAVDLQRQFIPDFRLKPGLLQYWGRMDKLMASDRCEQWRLAITPPDVRRERVKARPTPVPPLIDKQTITGLTCHTAAGGGIMNVSREGGACPAVVRSGQEYSLWTVGQKTAVRMEGLPPLYPPEVEFTVDWIRPEIALWDGRVFVGADPYGLYAIEPDTGVATRTGVPGSSVHVLLVRDGCFYAAGGGTTAGYLARRMHGSDEWTIWMAPRGLGPVLRICPRRDRSWLVYHAPENAGGRLPVSLFDRHTGRWQSAPRPEPEPFVYFSARTRIAADGDRSLKVARECRGSPIVLTDESTGERTTILYPDQRDWNVWLGGTMPATAPIDAMPVDVVADDGMFWILDASGGLTATPDGARFAGPFVVAGHGDVMCVASDSLWVSTGSSVVEVPLQVLRSRLQGGAAFRSSAEIAATIAGRLQKWLAQNEPAAIFDYLEDRNMAVPASCRERVLAYLKTACRNAVEAGDHDAADRAARALWGMGDPESAAAILEPLARDLGAVKSASLKDCIRSVTAGRSARRPAAQGREVGPR